MRIDRGLEESGKSSGFRAVAPSVDAGYYHPRRVYTSSLLSLSLFSLRRESSSCSSSSVGFALLARTPSSRVVYTRRLRDSFAPTGAGEEARWPISRRNVCGSGIEGGSGNRTMKISCRETGLLRSRVCVYTIRKVGAIRCSLSMRTRKIVRGLAATTVARVYERNDIVFHGLVYTFPVVYCCPLSRIDKTTDTCDNRLMAQRKCPISLARGTKK